MKLERRELVRQLAPDTAVNVLLACWEFLETGEKPTSLSPIESVAFSAFMPDMDEAWKRYLQRITARNQSVDIDRYQATSTETEEETEPETEVESKKERGGKPPRSRFSPPTIEEIKAYCQERQSSVDPEQFFDFYTANGWRQGAGKPIKDWQACIRTWERRNRDNAPESPAPRAKKYTIVDGEAVEVSGDA